MSRCVIPRARDPRVYSYATTFQPPIVNLLEYRQRHGCRRQPDVVKIADVELRAEPPLGVGAKLEPARLPHLVARRLPGPGAVALDLGGHGTAFLAGGLDHVVDRTLTAPALGMESGVHDAAGGAEQQRLQHPETPEGVIRVQPHLIAQLLGIERPAFGVCGEDATRLADERERGQLQHQRQLEVMPRLGLVIHERRQLPARPLARVTQIDVEGPGTRAIERRDLVVAAGGAGFRIGGDAADLQRRLRQDAEVLRQVWLQSLDEPVAVIEYLLAPGFGVRKQGLRILRQLLRTLAHGAAGLAL